MNYARWSHWSPMRFARTRPRCCGGSWIGIGKIVRSSPREEDNMSWKTAIAGSLAAALIIATMPCSAAEDVVIKVWSLAQRSGPLRAGNLVAAGDRSEEHTSELQ